MKSMASNNPEYEIAAGLSIEWYAMGDVQAPDYESAKYYDSQDL